MVKLHGERNIAATAQIIASIAMKQQRQVDQLVAKYQDFVTTPSRVPLHYQVKHLIEVLLGAQWPCVSTFYLGECGEQVTNPRIDQKGPHRPSDLRYGSPIVLVQRKDGSWQLFVDYKGVNEITIRNRYLIQWIEGLLDQLRGAKFFNKVHGTTSSNRVGRCVADDL